VLIWRSRHVPGLLHHKRHDPSQYVRSIRAREGAVCLSIVVVVALLPPPGGENPWARWWLDGPARFRGFLGRFSAG
jgi:hypothetical protein